MKISFYLVLIVLSAALIGGCSGFQKENSVSTQTEPEYDIQTSNIYDSAKTVQIINPDNNDNSTGNGMTSKMDSCSAHPNMMQKDSFHIMTNSDSTNHSMMSGEMISMIDTSKVDTLDKPVQPDDTVPAVSSGSSDEHDSHH